MTNRAFQQRSIFIIAALILVTPLAAMAAPSESFVMDRVTNRLKSIQEINGIFLFLAAVIAMKIGLVGGAVSLKAMAPDMARRATDRVAKRPKTTFILGLIESGALLLLLRAIAQGFGPRPIMVMIGLAILAAATAILLLGLSGVYGALGRRMTSTNIDDAGAVMRGGGALESATLIPLFGWIAQTIILCLGLGAGIMAIFEPGEKQDESI